MYRIARLCTILTLKCKLDKYKVRLAGGPGCFAKDHAMVSFLISMRIFRMNFM